ncbi:MAG: alpha/beta hydrolase fold domain-containing protein [Terriglobia bacterium]|jgi:epsilon-lactone hydrolase
MRTKGHGRAMGRLAFIMGAIWLVAPPLPDGRSSFSGLCAQQSTSSVTADTCSVDADGTAHVTRVIPVPRTISPEAQKFISRPGPSGPEPTLAERRTLTDAFRKGRSEEARKLYPVDIQEKTLGGVRCDVITPAPGEPPDSEMGGRVLINVHGGGFNSDSGSLVEGIPIAYLTKIPVVSLYYRLAPEHPFPAAVDDTEAVYKELLKTHKPSQIGLFGTSAGAVLTAEAASRFGRDGLPLPAALGVFSGTGDMSQGADSDALFTIWGWSGHLNPPSARPHASAYVGNTDPKDPVLSPLYADLHGFPPTLFVTSTRDLLLSGTTILHRTFLRAGVDAQLVVFEALPHAFWYDYHLPETKEALDIMAKFFSEKVGK